MGANSNALNSIDYRLALIGAIEVHDQLVISALSRASKMWGCNKSNISLKESPVNQSQRNPVVPSLITNKTTRKATTATTAAATNISPRISHIGLQPVITEVNTDEAEFLEKEVSFRIFGCTVKILWSPPTVKAPQRSMESLRNRNVSNFDQDQERIRQYVRVLLNMANGMANWMVNSKRYAVKKRD